MSELLLLFSAGEYRYALPCRRVREVISSVALQPLPGMADHVAGVFNYRGMITPVVDMCLLKVGRPAAARLSTRIVLFDAKVASRGKRTAGLLAERVTDTRRLDLGNKVQAGFSDAAEVVIEGGSMISLLDLDALIESAFGELLAGAGSSLSAQHAPADHRQ